MNPPIITKADQILNTYQVNCAPCTFFTHCSLILKFDVYNTFEIQESEVTFRHIYAIRIHPHISQRPTYYLYPENINFITYPRGWRLKPQTYFSEYTDLQPAKVYGVFNFGLYNAKCIEAEFMLNVYVDSASKIVWLPCAHSEQFCTYINLRITIEKNVYRLLAKEVEEEDNVIVSS